MVVLWLYTKAAFIQSEVLGQMGVLVARSVDLTQPKMSGQSWKGPNTATPTHAHLKSMEGCMWQVAKQTRQANVKEGLFHPGMWNFMMKRMTNGMTFHNPVYPLVITGL